MSDDVSVLTHALVLAVTAPSEARHAEVMVYVDRISVGMCELDVARAKQFASEQLMFMVKEGLS